MRLKDAKKTHAKQCYGETNRKCKRTYRSKREHNWSFNHEIEYYKYTNGITKKIKSSMH